MGAAKGMHSFDSALYYAKFEVLTNGVQTPPTPSYQPVAPNYQSFTEITNNTNDITGWKEVEDIISMNGFSMERSVTQLTHLRSPNKAHEKVPGFLDAGSVTLRLNYRKSLIATLQNLSPGGTFSPETYPALGRCSWAAFFPDHGIWVCHAFIKSTPIEVPEDNRLTVELALEVSGKPTFYAFA